MPGKSSGNTSGYSQTTGISSNDFASRWNTVNFVLRKMNIHRTICGGVKPDDTRRGIEDNTMFLHPIHPKNNIYPLAGKDKELGLKDFSTQVKRHTLN